MSLNNISLSPQLVADFYQTSLVQDASTPKPVPFLGENKKRILIVVNKKEVPFLPDKELQFLTTVLAACQLDLLHVAIVNWAAPKEKSFALLQKQFSPEKILLLDVAPEKTGLAMGAPYAVQTHPAFQFVAAPSLSEIEKTKQAKSSLWTALKQLFCL